MYTCSKCNATIREGKKFCRQCGTPVSQPKPLVVVALQKKFIVIACLRDFFLPGLGFLYTENMVEGAVIGIATILVTIWGIYEYIHLLIADIQANLPLVGSSYPPDFNTSNTFLLWSVALSLLWLLVRFGFLVSKVHEHNKSIAEAADASQIITFIRGK